MIDNRLNLQRLLFENAVSRKMLVDYEPQNQKRFKVCVYRNHSFELIEHTISAYLDYSDCVSEFVYSDYDDSLTFLNFDQSSDMAIIWLDISRYTDKNEAIPFIEERVKWLSKNYGKPILLAVCGGQIEIADQNVVVFNIDDISEFDNAKLYDERMLNVSGTRLSSKAMMRIAKGIGLQYIPSMLTVPLKAIIVDLDNTLYKGVLGEDGIEGIELTPGHVKLQQELKRLKEAGFFLAVISKNEQADVLEMFEKRSDFPLTKNDFTTIKASWNEKSLMMQEALAFLNIHYDSVVFVDDNVGELNSMDMRFSGIPFIHALDDAMTTTIVLKNYPRLRKTHISVEDGLRTKDSQANAERAELKEKMSEEEYLKALDVTIEFGVDRQESKVRISELANKTNQFIFNYRRYTLDDVDRFLQDNDKTVITVSLKDKLSDSGIIGVCAAIKQNDVAVIDELFVSCRALGRGIDDVIVKGAISIACEKLNCSRVKVLFRKGDRNLPAERFVADKLSQYLEMPNEFSYEFPVETINIKKEGIL